MINNEKRLGDLAKRDPERKVRLLFKDRNSGQRGYLDLTAKKAANPNKSNRYFPPDGENAADLGWPVPYWYAEEIVRVIVL